jgi:hypothetical protein
VEALVPFKVDIGQKDARGLTPLDYVRTEAGVSPQILVALGWSGVILLPFPTGEPIAVDKHTQITKLSSQLWSVAGSSGRAFSNEQQRQREKEVDSLPNDIECGNLFDRDFYQTTGQVPLYRGSSIVLPPSPPVRPLVKYSPVLGSAEVMATVPTLKDILGVKSEAAVTALTTASSFWIHAHTRQSQIN